MTEEKNILKKRIETLVSGKDEAVFNELDTLREQGSLELMPHLIDRWNATENEELKSKIFQFLIDVKSQELTDVIFDKLRDPHFEDIHAELVSVLWQSTMDASEYFNDLIEVAISGSYLTVLEVSTVIESFDQVFNEQDVMEAIYQIDERILEEESEEMKNLLDSLKSVVSNLPVE